MKTLRLIILFNLVAILGSTQGYKIEVEVNGLKDTTIFLANYFGKKMYYADTAIVNNKGVAVFEGHEAFKGGKYALVMPGPKFFDLILDEQHFELKTDTSDYVRNIEFKGSESNKIYYNYILFISKKKSELQALKLGLEGLDENSPEAKVIKEKMIIVDQSVVSRQKELTEKHKGSLAATIIGMTIPIQIPDAPVDDKGNITDSLFQYRYYIEHYLDNTPLEDSRIVRTPEFDKKLNDFFNTALPQSPDTMIKYADWILPQVRYDSDLYKFTLHFLTYNFQSSKFMGMDKAYVHMIEEYYTKGGITWMDETKLADIIEEAMLIKPTLIGEKAPFFRLHDPTATTFTNLYEVESELTLIYIWQPDCGHCKKANPKLVELNEKYKNKGLKILSISVDFENEEWIKYLEEHLEFSKLHNLSDSPKHPSPFRSLYNSKTTPTILLLDRDKKIIAKKLDIEQLDKFIERKLNEKS
ncbi:MAG: thiol-disulfide isomerase/thioredoxin [Patiriisocius sp.]|jgi:thiol-disulfide isomerase/thioredoxin